MTERALVYQWAVCGIAAAAARFVPVPFVDDIIRQRAAQTALARTLRAHSRSYSSDKLEPLWGDPDGAKGLGRHFRKLAKKLVLFPIRKYVALVGAVRGVPTDILRVILLARSVDRRLARGELTDSENLAAEAKSLRLAVDEAMRHVDLRIITAALADALSQSRDLTGTAVAFARRRFSGSDSNSDLKPDDEVANSADRVVEAFDRPEIVQLLENFDQKVDSFTR